MHNKHHPIAIEHSYRAKRVVTVYCLINNEEQTFTDITPLNALITAYILTTNPQCIDDNVTRAAAAKKICFGKSSATIGDLGVML